MEIVGRDEELVSLNAFLDRAAGGVSVLVLEGDAGIGKSTLWLAGVEGARDRSFRVLSSRPAEAESGLALSGLGDLFEDVLEQVLPELPVPRRRALEIALLVEEAGEDPADARALGLAVRTALQLLAENEPVVLAIDDVQWLDVSSAVALSFALRRLDGNVRLLLSRRLEEGAPATGLERAVDDDRLQRLRVGPLSLGAMHVLLQQRLDTAFARPTLLRLHEASGGNPFYALELARALKRRGSRLAPGDQLPIPTSLEELVQERLDGLSAPALEVARFVAALAYPTVGVVDAAVGPSAEPGLTDALESGVLELDGERLRFTHPLLASAVSSRSPPARRRSLHARLAAVVPTGEERAHHLALATAEPSREIASVLDDAARTAHARGAPTAAAELAEHALRLTPIADVEDARRRLVTVADRHHEAGDNDRAIALLDRALAVAARGVERAAVLVHLAPVKKDVLGPRTAVALYREALAEAEGDDALAATIHVRLAELMRFGEGVGVKRGVAHAELAVRAASRVDDAALRCRALAAYGLLHFNAGQGIPRAEMEEALALERALPEWPLGDGPTWVCGYQLWWSDDLGAARPVLHEFREALNARDDPEELVALWHLGFLEWRAGNWELGARYLADSHALETQAGRLGMWPAQEAPATVIAAHRGQIDEARAGAEHALAEAEAEGIRIAQSAHLWVLGFIELSLGNAAAALEHLKPAWEIRDEIGLLEPGMRLELGDTLEALIAVGELDEAERILVPWEERARALDRAWALAWLARCRALLLAARGDVQGAFGEFDRALAEHARSVDPFHHARTLLALGVTQRRAKQRGTARATLESALEIFERLGAPLWAEKTRAELGRIGGRTRQEGLTPAEHRVAALVAEGRTNREVAAALFLGERTIASHLTHIYAKLGVRSRTELARRLR